MIDDLSDLIAAMKPKLLPCPFCAQAAIVEPWHGGGPHMVMISCAGLNPETDDVEQCEAAPTVTGETPDEALGRWNTRAPLISKPPKAGLEIYISGPRGCGKSTLADRLRQVLPDILIFEGEDYAPKRRESDR